jgi:hypothetical protein
MKYVSYQAAEALKIKCVSYEKDFVVDTGARFVQILMKAEQTQLIPRLSIPFKTRIMLPKNQL